MSGKALKEVVNSKVPRELIKANVKMALTKLDLERVRYEVVGNTTKPVVGDIDIAIDKLSLAGQWNLSLDNSQDFWHGFETKLKELGIPERYYKIVPGWKQVYMAFPLVKSDFQPSRYAVLNEQEACWLQEQESAMIQIDLLIGNIDWISKVQGSADIESAYKALYRTNLVADIVNSFEHNRTTQGYERLVMDYSEGVFHETHLLKQPTGRQRVVQDELVEKTLVTSNPDELARMLFGPFVKWDHINSFESVWSLVQQTKTRNFNYKLLLTALNKFKIRLEKEGLQVPAVVNETIENQGKIH